MKQTILAGVVGGIVLSFWGALAWMVLPLHDASVHGLDSEDAIIEVLRANIAAQGVYYFPHLRAETAEMTDAEREAAEEEVAEKYRRGPIGMIVYNPLGAEPMMVGQFVSGFIINIIAAFLAAWFLSRSTAAASSYLARVAFCGMLGVFASVVVHLPYWNWMAFPLNFTTAMVADTVIGWLLAGAAISAIVKMPSAEA